MHENSKQLIIKIAESVIDTFVVKWQSTPYMWAQEIDVQVELVTRIKEQLSATIAPGVDSASLLKLSARLGVRIPGDPVTQTISRIGCEPYVKASKKERAIKPDIVIWDDQPVGTDKINQGFWPIIWACEIKYKTHDPESTEDKNRMLRLIDKREKRAKRAYVLSLYWGSAQRQRGSDECTFGKRDADKGLCVREVQPAPLSSRMPKEAI